MKKYIAGGVFAIGLILAGGTGYYFGNAHENATIDLFSLMDTGQVTPMMSTVNMSGIQQLVQKPTQNSTFEQMLPYMKKMHPNLSNKELKDLFDSMHGANGAPSCSAMLGSLSI